MHDAYRFMLESILERIDVRLLILEGNIMSALSDLQVAVANEDTVIASAITLINGFAAQLAAAGTDAAALAALQADVTARASALAAAVASNTPAAPAPAPASAPVEAHAPAPAEAPAPAASEPAAPAAPAA